MKALVKFFAATLALSAAVAAPAFAASDGEDLTAAHSLCRAEVTKQTGTPDAQLRNGSFTLKAKWLKLKVMMKTDAGTKFATCTFDRDAQTVSLALPDGVTPAVATAAAPAAAPVTQ